MLSGLERHFSVVSLLLIAGAGLILLEGPVGPSYLRQWVAPKTVEKESPKATDSQAQAQAAPDSTKQVAKTVNLDARNSTWASMVNDASPLHQTVLGEIPLSDRTTSSSEISGSWLFGGSDPATSGYPGANLRGSLQLKSLRKSPEVRFINLEGME